MQKIGRLPVRSRPHISLDPWIFGIPQEELIAFAKKIGFDGIEYMLTLRDLAFGSAKILTYSKKHKIPITSLHQPLLLLIYTPSWLFGQMLSIATRFPDVQLVNHHLSAFMFKKVSPIRALAYKKMFEAKSIQVTFESNPGGNGISTQYAKPTYDPRTFQAFCQKYQLPMNLDVCHIAHMGYDIVKFFSENHELIHLIHLSDFKDGKEHLPLGEGNLPLRELLQEIRKTNWSGTITCEIYRFPNQKTKQEKLQAIQKSLTFIHENLNR